MRRRSGRRRYAEPLNLRRSGQITRAVNDVSILFTLVKSALEHTERTPQVRQRSSIVVERLGSARRARLWRGRKADSAVRGRQRQTVRACASTSSNDSASSAIKGRRGSHGSIHRVSARATQGRIHRPALHGQHTFKVGADGAAWPQSALPGPRPLAAGPLAHVCPRRRQQFAQHRTMAMRFVLAIAADRKVRVDAKARRARRSSAHFRPLPFPDGMLFGRPATRVRSKPPAPLSTYLRSARGSDTRRRTSSVRRTVLRHTARRAPHGADPKAFVLRSADCPA
jgi:hypothetical protein